MPEEGKESITVPIYKKGDKTDCSSYTDIQFFSTRYKILSEIPLSKLTPYAEEIIGNHRVDFSVTDQLLIIYSAFVKHLKKNDNETWQCISHL